MVCTIRRNRARVISSSSESYNDAAGADTSSRAAGGHSPVHSDSPVAPKWPPAVLRPSFTSWGVVMYTLDLFPSGLWSCTCFPLLGSFAHSTWFVGMGRFAALPHAWFVGTLQTLGPVYLTVGLRGLTVMPPSLAGLHLCCYGVAPLCPATPMEVVAYTTLPYRPSCGFCTCLLLLSPLHFVLFCKLWRLLIVLGHFCDSSATIKQQQLHCMRAISLSFYYPCTLFYFASYGGYWLFWSTSVILVLPSSSNNCIVCAQSSCHFYRPCILFYFANSGDYWLFWSTPMILVLPLSSNNCVVCARPSYHMYMFPVIFHLWCLLTDRYWFSLYLPCVLPYTSKWGLVCFS